MKITLSNRNKTLNRHRRDGGDPLGAAAGPVVHLAGEVLEGDGPSEVAVDYLSRP